MDPGVGAKQIYIRLDGIKKTIAQEIVQGTADAAAQIRNSRLALAAAGNGRTRASRACSAEAFYWRDEDGREATFGDSAEPHPQRLRCSIRSRTPDAEGRMTRSLMWRQEWPMEQVGVRQPGGGPGGGRGQSA